MYSDTIALEDKYMVSFGVKSPIVIERGSGVSVWDEKGNHFLDFTAGWAVTSLGHAHPVFLKALAEQAARICQNPDSGLTYSPARGRLLAQLIKILPAELHHFFFVNSGAEATDAALKLSRKITGRKWIVSTSRSFHGRTIGATSVTGQAVQRDRYDVLVPYCRFIPFDDVAAAREAIDNDVAAVIVEPIQGEGGVIVPSPDYLPHISRLCAQSNALLIVDEIQTGFWRTGPAFASTAQGVLPDFITMAKGIAGGFPFGCVAVSQRAMKGIEHGDHGGTYCGNPLGCAVAAAVVEYLISTDTESWVKQLGSLCRSRLEQIGKKFPDAVKEVRGCGMLQAIEFRTGETAQRVHAAALANGLILNIKHGTIIRIFPALTITKKELVEGLSILESAVRGAAGV